MTNCLIWILTLLGLAGEAAWANHVHMPSGAFGGIVLAVVADGANPQVLYAAVFGGGVFKSTSGGQMWTGINQGLENAHVLCLVQDPITPAVLYLCTDAGIFKTSVDGERWLPASHGLEARNIRAIAVHPQRPARLLAATDAGVYRSDNGGARWDPAPEGLTDLDVRAIAFDPQRPDVVYAATFSGLFKSRDGGQTWQLTHTQPADSYLRALAMAPQRPDTLYVGTARSGIYRSTDGGESWTALNEGLGSRSVLSLTMAPTDPTTLYAGTVAGLYRLRAGEPRWTLLGGERLLSVTAVAPDPHARDSLYVGTGGTILKTSDGGHTWTDLSRWVLYPMPTGAPLSGSAGLPVPATEHSSQERR